MHGVIFGMSWSLYIVSKISNDMILLNTIFVLLKKLGNKVIKINLKMSEHVMLTINT